MARRASPSAATKPTQAPAIVDEVLRSGGGRSLGAGTRAYFEPRFGYDFGKVRVHDDLLADRSARALSAVAYTVGHDVVFRRGTYSPEATDGRRLLAHELAHVVQQSTGVVHSAPSGTLAVVPAVDRSEREADRMANAVVLADAKALGTDAPGGEAVASFITAQSPRAGVLHVARRADRGGDTDMEGPRDAGLPGGVETPAPEPESDKGGGGSGKASSLLDCTAVMGGRGIEFGPGNIAGAVFNHTYVNFYENAKDYWLIEGGPLPSDPKKSGAWAKKGGWENRGNRKTRTWPAHECPTIKKLLLDTQEIYHSAALPYSPWDGPNSNSFAEHLTFKADIPNDFRFGDKAWDYWRSRARPS